ncbi:MAG TPA: hydroxysqualene dehydroxylase HpnE [Rhodocyclaceae bacterium]|nr:hydroxysqualene dehydroxylase HpnE [Rhodocyclaceae bacterium]
MKVAIVGGGYAGMAAAAELAARGMTVDVFEASRILGGRARAVELDGVTVDNGAHILAGAYGETLRLMAVVGAEPDRQLARRPLHLEFPGRFRLAAPRLPAPWHLAWALLTARGIGLTEKVAALHFMEGVKRRRYRLDGDRPVAQLLDEFRQSANLRRHLWEPLCVAALNTPAASASAQVFLNVLRDSLAAEASASDLLLPATDLSSLFPEPAAGYVEAHGGRVLRERRVKTIEAAVDGFRLDGELDYDQVILAVAPQHLPPLLAALPALAPVATKAAAFAFEPIVTVYLAYPQAVSLPLPMVGVADGIAQWVFDRGRLCAQPGLLAAVISAHGGHEEMDHATLAERVHRDIAALVPGLPSPRWSRVIAEKRATFACTPGLIRPRTVTALPGLLLAGDYVAGDYPATLEGAVRSGIAAARMAVA